MLLVNIDYWYRYKMTISLR